MGLRPINSMIQTWGKVEISRDVIFDEDRTWKWSSEMVKSTGGTFSIDSSYDPTSPPDD